MSDEHQGSPVPPGRAEQWGYVQQPAYGPPAFPGYAAQPVRGPRPPLTRRQRRAALVAGGIGFSLMSLGVALLLVACSIVLIGALTGWIGTWIAGKTNEAGVFAGNLAELWNDTWWIVAGIALGGVVFWLAGYLTSVLVMRRARVNHPAGTTWAGIGVGVVAWWIVSMVIGAVFQIAPFFRLDGGTSDLNDSPVYMIVWAIVLVATNIAIGCLSWWWMAHCLRARQTPA